MTASIYFIKVSSGFILFLLAQYAYCQRPYPEDLEPGPSADCWYHSISYCPDIFSKFEPNKIPELVKVYPFAETELFLISSRGQIDCNWYSRANYGFCDKDMSPPPDIEVCDHPDPDSGTYRKPPLTPGRNKGEGQERQYFEKLYIEFISIDRCYWILRLPSTCHETFSPRVLRTYDLQTYLTKKMTVRGIVTQQYDFVESWLTFRGTLGLGDDEILPLIRYPAWSTAVIGCHYWKKDNTPEVPYPPLEPHTPYSPRCSAQRHHFKEPTEGPGGLGVSDGQSDDLAVFNQADTIIAHHEEAYWRWRDDEVDEEGNLATYVGLREILSPQYHYWVNTRRVDSTYYRALWLQFVTDQPLKATDAEIRDLGYRARRMGIHLSVEVVPPLVSKQHDYPAFNEHWINTTQWNENYQSWEYAGTIFEKMAESVRPWYSFVKAKAMYYWEDVCFIYSSFCGKSYMDYFASFDALKHTWCEQEETFKMAETYMHSWKLDPNGDYWDF